MPQVINIFHLYGIQAKAVDFFSVSFFWSHSEFSLTLDSPINLKLALLTY